MALVRRPWEGVYVDLSRWTGHEATRVPAGRSSRRRQPILPVCQPPVSGEKLFESVSLFVLLQGLILPAPSPDL